MPVRRGDHRCVFPFGPVVVKVPRLRRLRSGCCCNQWELEMWCRWRPAFRWRSLCPILAGDPLLGLFVVMRRAGGTVSPDETEEAYPTEYTEITSEGKPDDFRRLDGQIVVVDYGLADRETVRMQREEYARKLRDRR